MGLPFALTIGAVTFLLGVIWGGPLIVVLRRLGVGKLIRAELGERQQRKVGTPTMGGVLIIVSVVLLTLGLNVANVVRQVSGLSILLPAAVLLGYGVLGAIDDRAGIQRSRGPVGEGLPGRVKFAAQVVMAVIVSVFISQFDSGFSYANAVNVPLIANSIPLSPVLFIPLGAFFIVATSNAVNFTDGLDGLAGIISASAFAAYGIIAFLQEQIFLTQFCFIVVGACFAFLWYNAHPAQMFMGDTGALALGAALGTVAVMTGQWLLLPVIAIVPLAETLSVILQVASARWSRRYRGVDRRLFRQAPLHGHFELGGWSEPQIVQRFWLVGLLSAMLGVALALI